MNYYYLCLQIQLITGGIAVQLRDFCSIIVPFIFFWSESVVSKPLFAELHRGVQPLNSVTDWQKKKVG
jgi:hypothetical protein